MCNCLFASAILTGICDCESWPQLRGLVGCGKCVSPRHILITNFFLFLVKIIVYILSRRWWKYHAIFFNTISYLLLRQNNFNAMCPTQPQLHYIVLCNMRSVAWCIVYLHQGPMSKSDRVILTAARLYLRSSH